MRGFRIAQMHADKPTRTILVGNKLDLKRNQVVTSIGKNINRCDYLKNWIQKESVCRRSTRAAMSKSRPFSEWIWTSCGLNLFVSSSTRERRPGWKESWIEEKSLQSRAKLSSKWLQPEYFPYRTYCVLPIVIPPPVWYFATCTSDKWFVTCFEKATKKRRGRLVIIVWLSDN